MDREFSVSKTAEVLGIKNEENVRRWIREGRLVAKRRLGRKGNVVLLEDIVEFANKPPRTYLSALVSWLDNEGIQYKKISDPSSQKDLINAVQRSAATAGAMAALAPVVPLFPIVAGAAAATATAKKQQKTQVPFTIELIAPTNTTSLEDIPNNQDSTEGVANEKQEGIVASETNLNDELTGEATQYNTPSEEIDIKAKIVEEQIKLIKLKQELAQIQAQISVAEGQIEYYNLLLQNN